jgi:hypothetical protein
MRSWPFGHQRNITGMPAREDVLADYKKQVIFRNHNLITYR